MACSSSIVGGVSSSIYLTTPSLPFHFSTSQNPFRPFSSAIVGLKCSASSSFVPAVVISTPNSSVLSEEAFKGLGGFGKSPFGVRESEYVEEFEGKLESKSESRNVDELDISKLGLPQRLIDTLEKRGITQLFPIQRAVLLPALEGRDIIARARTGTGKTLAFGIPIIKGLNDTEKGDSLRRGRLPKVLVLAPTRELAKQVEKEFQESAPYLNTVCIYGGVSYVTQKTALSRGVDVVVGTPGRIIDLINNNNLKLGEVQYVVLDEADQMLAVGFEEDVEVILQNLPSERQSMLFSATMPGWIKKLARKHLDNPLTVDLVGDRGGKLAEGIKLYAIPTTATSKRTILGDLVTVYAKGGKAIIFTRTKRDADEVSFALTSSIASAALHGDISQPQRERTLNGFRQGKFTVLVATDVAARGLDIPNVDLIIHYELPNDPETFVHRSGRTGRAGKAGTAVLMFTSSQRQTVKSLERDVGCKFEFISPSSFQEVLGASAEHVVSTFSGVRPESVEFFAPTAQKLMNRQGVDAPSDYYGKFSSSERRPQRGSRDRRGSRSSQDWLDGDDFEDSFKRGGHSSRSESRWPKSSKSSGNDWLIGDRRSNPSVGSRDSRSFGGACFNCGRSGHRASECPNKKGY